MDPRNIASVSPETDGVARRARGAVCACAGAGAVRVSPGCAGRARCRSPGAAADERSLRARGGARHRGQGGEISGAAVGACGCPTDVL